MSDHDTLIAVREDLKYVRKRLDSLYKDVGGIKVKLSGFMGRAIGVAATVSVLTTAIVAAVMTFI